MNSLSVSGFSARIASLTSGRRSCSTRSSRADPRVPVARVGHERVPTELPPEHHSHGTRRHLTGDRNTLCCRDFRKTVEQIPPLVRRPVTLYDRHGHRPLRGLDDRADELHLLGLVHEVGDEVDDAGARLREPCRHAGEFFPRGGQARCGFAPRTSCGPRIGRWTSRVHPTRPPRRQGRASGPSRPR